MDERPESAPAAATPPLLHVHDLQVAFPARGGRIAPAVDRVSFHLAAGETLGLVGESGSGKTTVARAVLRLVPACGGRVLFDGQAVLDLGSRALRRLRRSMQIIFQDPGGSLNRRHRAGSIVAEPMIIHRLARGAEATRRATTLLDRCGLPAGAADRYPHEFSGGQRQRIAIARALACEPKLIICDEPTSALDVSIQAQILNLLRDLQDERGLSFLFISHDLGVVHHMCDRVAVMHRGRIVEQGPREEIIGNPQHAYTRSLLAAVPQLAASATRQADSATTTRARS